VGDFVKYLVKDVVIKSATDIRLKNRHGLFCAEHVKSLSLVTDVRRRIEKRVKEEAGGEESQK
jgi:hypothetical protein